VYLNAAGANFDGVIPHVGGEVEVEVAGGEEGVEAKVHLLRCLHMKHTVVDLELVAEDAVKAAVEGEISVREALERRKESLPFSRMLHVHLSNRRLKNYKTTAVASLADGANDKLLEKLVDKSSVIVSGSHMVGFYGRTFADRLDRMKVNDKKFYHTGTGTGRRTPPRCPDNAGVCKKSNVTSVIMKANNSMPLVFRIIRNSKTAVQRCIC
jgi:hypothetical protein